MLSMTGFGAGSAEGPHGAVIAEARSVNARTLDVRCRLPEALGDTSLWAEQLVRGRIRRGRVEIVVRSTGPSAVGVEIDRARARSAIGALSELARDAGVAEPPLGLLAALPGLFVASEADRASLRTSAEAATTAALDALDRDRAREGAVIRRELEARARTISNELGALRERTSELPALFRARLAERLARLAAPVDPSRIDGEVAILAERTDVSEELERLASHTSHLLAILVGAAEAPEGRRLDFLLQEMQREATTLSAKAQDAETSRRVVSLKVEIERIREQVQNVE
jgi:uncharacterized protein (TIGR00255 family)